VSSVLKLMSREVKRGVNAFSNIESTVEIEVNKAIRRNRSPSLLIKIKYMQYVDILLPSLKGTVLQDLKPFCGSG
jgi:hypothetical protein